MPAGHPAVPASDITALTANRSVCANSRAVAGEPAADGTFGTPRDYCGLTVIEQRTGRTADQGLALFVERFQPEYPRQAIGHILLGLGLSDDVDPDDAPRGGRPASHSAGLRRRTGESGTSPSEQGAQ